MLRRMSKIGDSFQISDNVSIVSECLDGCHVLCRDQYAKTSIWSRESRALLWKSGKLENDYQNCITHAEAEKIIRNCGQETPRLWPSSFPTYTAELYWESRSVYSSMLGECTLLANIVPFRDWKYNVRERLFAAGMKAGAVAVCKLITE